MKNYSEKKPENNGLLNTTVKAMLEETIFWTNKKNPLVANYRQGNPNLLVVVGDNATGKSFLVDTMRSMAKAENEDVSTISISIRERTGSGLDPSASFRKIAMFGDESTNSTGAISGSMIEKGFNNLQSRAEDGKRTILVLDEPEMGLSENYHSAVGELIAKKTQQACANKEDHVIIVATHSRKLVKALNEHLLVQPSAICMGEHKDLESWIKDEADKTLEDLLSLPKKSKETFRKIEENLEEMKKINRQRKASSPNP